MPCHVAVGLVLPVVEGLPDADAANDELKAQMMVAVMTSEDVQRMLDDKYGANTYSLAALTPYVSDPKLEIHVSIQGSTATASIGVGLTVALYGPQGLLATLTPYLYFEEQLTMDINVDGGVLWIDLGVLFKIMKAQGTHEGCIEQMERLFAERLYTADKKVPVDSENRIRIDDWELAPEVQAEVDKAMPNVTEENVSEYCDLEGLRHDFLMINGFDVPGVDYDKEITKMNEID